MEKRKVDAILVIPQDFSAQVTRGQGKVQGIYYGVDTSVAMSIESYVNSAINLWAVKNIPFMLRGGYITMNPRMWFNEANTSTGFDSWAHHDYHDDCICFSYGCRYG
ncbi:MAG: hypothetical protein ACLUPK_00675 [Veillonella sp.]